MTKLVTPLVGLAWLGIIGGGIAAVADSRVVLPWWAFVALGVLVVAALLVTSLRERATEVPAIAAAVVGAAAAVALFAQIGEYSRYALMFAGFCLLVAALVGAFARPQQRTPQRSYAGVRG